jgi:phage terminase large subunit-like protein
LDELREHQKWDAWSAATKTTMTRDEAQVIGASNAGDSTSIVLRHLRQLAHMALGDPDGINGDDAEPLPVETDELEGELDDAIGLFEWSAPPGCSKWDRAGWQAANPSMGWKRTFERKLASFAGSDPEAEFRTECLCQWVESMQEGAFPSGVWESQRENNLRITTQPTVALDIRGGMRQSMSLVAVGGTDAGVDLAIVARYELGRGKQWAESHVVDYVEAELKARGLTSIVMDNHGENGPLIPLLEKKGIEVIALSMEDMKNGCMGFHSAVINGRCKHLGEEPLTVAVAGAQSRVAGEAWIWSRTRSLTDIGPLMAAAGAWWVHSSREPLDYDIAQSVY